MTKPSRLSIVRKLSKALRQQLEALKICLFSSVIKHIAALYFYDDHQRNPNNNERDHIVGRLTTYILAALTGVQDNEAWTMVWIWAGLLYQQLSGTIGRIKGDWVQDNWWRAYWQRIEPSPHKTPLYRKNKIHRGCGLFYILKSVDRSVIYLTIWKLLRYHWGRKLTSADWWNSRKTRLGKVFQEFTGLKGYHSAGTRTLGGKNASSWCLVPRGE